MPTYDFKCRDCGKVSELMLTGPADNRQLACNSCGSHKLERLISAPNVLKGQHDHADGVRCCGRTEQCDQPPCSCHEH